MADYFDEDYEYQEFKQEMDSKSKHLQRWQAEQAQKYNDNVLNGMWQESLQEEGLDPQTYGNLAAQDPEFVKAELKRSMKSLIGNVKKGQSRNPKTGQYMSQPQGQQPQAQRAKESQAKLDSLKETANKRPLSHEEELDVLDALFGSKPLWKD